MTDESDRLRADIERLSAENAALRAAAGAAPSASVPRTPRRRRWRAVVSAICLVLAGVLVPLSVVGGWARAVGR